MKKNCPEEKMEMGMEEGKKPAKKAKGKGKKKAMSIKDIEDEYSEKYGKKKG